MAGYERWTKATVTLVLPIFKGAFEDPATKHAMGKALLDEVFDGAPIKTHGTPLTPENEFRNKLFRAYLEVQASFVALKDIEIYIARFPYEDRVKRSAHLKYHFQNYMNDVYVLKLRLLNYLTIVPRCYHRNDPMRATIEAAFKLIETAIKATLAPIVNTRGMHVHQHRFDHPDFSRLGTLEFFEATPITEDEEVIEAWHGQYMAVYRELRRKWKKTIHDNNEALSKLLDTVGDGIADTIFTGPDGAVVLPKHLQLAPPVPATPAPAAPPGSGATL